MHVEPQHEGARYYDAHLHLQDRTLTEEQKGLTAGSGVVAQLCNGTYPGDWEAVESIHDHGSTHVLKAYGVHPWKVDELEQGWEDQLRRQLASGAASIGEIGLDRWIEVKDEHWQLEVFERQLRIASDCDLVPTIHCLRAWGLLIDALKAGPPLKRGFMVHGFGGSKEVQYQLLDMGGCFSFSAYAADPKRSRMREAIKACPEDRLLAETDAPDMVPPEDVCRHRIFDEGGKRLHHPMEIITAYRVIADLRTVSVSEIAPTIEGNFKRLFLRDQ